MDGLVRGGLPEDVRLKLFGFHKHIKSGALTQLDRREQVEGSDPITPTRERPISSGSTVTGELSPAQREAWASCGDMSEDHAKKQFLTTLFTAATYWKYEQFI